MTTKRIDASEVRRTFFDVLDQLPSEGPVEVLRHGKPVARIEPPATADLATKPAIDPRRIARLCKQHKIRRLALFGSVLRDDFGPESDIDVLIDPAPGGLDTLRTFIAALLALEALFGRKVDLVKRELVEGRSFRGREILDTAQVIYDAK